MLGLPIWAIGDAVVTYFKDNIVGVPVYGSNPDSQPLDIDQAINNGNVVMTNVLENGKNLHNILIIGYTSDNEYIYIDPRDEQSFYKCSKDGLKTMFNTKYFFEFCLPKKA